MKNKKMICFIISAIIIFAGIISIAIQGLNLGIDFRGGNLLSIEFNGEIDESAVINIINEAGGKDTRLQKGAGNSYEIRFYNDENDEGYIYSEKLYD